MVYIVLVHFLNMCNHDIYFPLGVHLIEPCLEGQLMGYSACIVIYECILNSGCTIRVYLSGTSVDCATSIQIRRSSNLMGLKVEKKQLSTVARGWHMYIGCIRSPRRGERRNLASTGWSGGRWRVHTATVGLYGQSFARTSLRRPWEQQSEWYVSGGVTIEVNTLVHCCRWCIHQESRITWTFVSVCSIINDFFTQEYDIPTTIAGQIKSYISLKPLPPR